MLDLIGGGAFIKGDEEIVSVHALCGHVLVHVAVSHKEHHLSLSIHVEVAGREAILIAVALDCGLLGLQGRCGDGIFSAGNSDGVTGAIVDLYALRESRKAGALDDGEVFCAGNDDLVYGSHIQFFIEGCVIVDELLVHGPQSAVAVNGLEVLRHVQRGLGHRQRDGVCGRGIQRAIVGLEDQSHRVTCGLAVVGRCVGVGGGCVHCFCAVNGNAVGQFVAVHVGEDGCEIQTVCGVLGNRCDGCLLNSFGQGGCTVDLDLDDYVRKAAENSLSGSSCGHSAGLSVGNFAAVSACCAAGESAHGNGSLCEGEGVFIPVGRNGNGQSLCKAAEVILPVRMLCNVAYRYLGAGLIII